MVNDFISFTKGFRVKTVPHVWKHPREAHQLGVQSYHYTVARALRDQTLAVESVSHIFIEHYLAHVQTLGLSEEDAAALRIIIREEIFPVYFDTSDINGRKVKNRWNSKLAEHDELVAKLATACENSSETAHLALPPFYAELARRLLSDRAQGSPSEILLVIMNGTAGYASQAKLPAPARRELNNLVRTRILPVLFPDEGVRAAMEAEWANYM